MVNQGHHLFQLASFYKLSARSICGWTFCLHMIFKLSIVNMRAVRIDKLSCNPTLLSWRHFSSDALVFLRLNPLSPQDTWCQTTKCILLKCLITSFFIVARMDRSDQHSKHSLFKLCGKDQCGKYQTQERQQYEKQTHGHRGKLHSKQQKNGNGEQLSEWIPKSRSRLLSSLSSSLGTNILTIANSIIIYLEAFDYAACLRIFDYLPSFVLRLKYVYTVAIVMAESSGFHLPCRRDFARCSHRNCTDLDGLPFGCPIFCPF